MGLLERLIAAGAPKRPPEPEPALEFTVTIGQETSRFSIPVDSDSYDFEDVADDAPQQSAAECWRPLGEQIEIHGRQIKGGVYVGSGLRGADSTYIREPSLIDPALSVGSSSNVDGPEKSYWPSYERLDDAQRGAYLDWLSGPRRADGAPDTFLFIYFYGLERRLLSDPGAGAERPALIAELRRLSSELDGGEAHRGFAHLLSRLRDFLDAQDVLRGVSELQPPREQAGWEVPMTLRLMIGELAKGSLPLPAELAVSWIVTSPEAYLRTPATRCSAEFAELFEIRYRERFGEGIELPRGPFLMLSYRSASQGLSEVSEATGVPDVVGSDALIVPLRELGRDCSSELDGLSRWLGRNPDGAGSFKAAALLPGPLLAGATSPELDSLREMLARTTAGEAPWSFDLGELIELWSPGAEKLPKKESVMAIQLIEGLGYGVEPDQRFGGPSPRPGTKGVLFNSQDGDPRAPSPAYATASLLLHLQAAVAAADGTVSAEEAEQLESHIHGVKELYAGERTRLHAHAQWLTLSTPKLSGLRKKLEGLSASQRQAIAGSLVTLAAADGEISPEEVKTLSKIFDLLGLDPKSVYSALHGVTSAGPGEAGPLIGEGDLSAGGAHPPSGTGEQRPRALNRDAIDKKVEETALVSTMLAGIFEDPEEEAAPSAPDGEPAGPSAARELLRRLCERETWSRQELETLAAELELMVDGEIEKLNEAAFESCGEALAEGDDPVYIDTQVGKELMA